MAWWKRSAPEGDESRAIDLSSLGQYTASAILDALTTDPVSVTIDKALGVPAVWAAVNFISDTVSTLPFQLFGRMEGDQREALRADPLYRILHDAPNTEWTAADFLKYLVWQPLTGGRGVAYIERSGNGRILNLWPLDPTRIRVRRNGLRRVYIFREDDGREQAYEANEVIDVTFALATDQITAKSPIYSNSDAIALNIALQKYAQKLFLNGGVPPLALQGPFNTPGAVQRASDDVTNAIRQAGQQGKQILPLPNGHELKALGINPEQGQFIEGRLFALQEVARIYGLPPVFLQDLSHGTMANTEQQDLNVAKHTLSHWLHKLEQEFNLKLFGRTNNRRFVEFNLDGLLRGDFRTRMEGYAKAIQNSISTPNEVRARENLPRKDGADELVIQQNMTGVTQLGGSNGNASAPGG